VLSIILVRKLGIVGVAIGTCVPILVISLIMMPLYVCKVYNISKKTYFINIYRSASISCLALFLPCLISIRYLSNSYLSLVVIVTLTTIWYAACSWFMLFKKEEKSVFIATLSRKRTMAGAPI
jgi:O-antigen/teichoic acid export membrane protein